MKTENTMTNNNNTLVRISPSLIGMLLECPLCLWLHFNEERKRPRGAFPSLPDGMDNVFKEYFDRYRSQGSLPPELAGKIEAKLFDDMEKLSVWREINFGIGGLRAEFPEYGLLLTGALDDVLVSPQGLYIPIDFKTRGYPRKEDTHEHYRHQLDCYGLLLKQNGIPVADFGYLLFFWPVKYNAGSAVFETELVKMSISSERAKKILEDVAKIIRGPKPEAHGNCEFCLYREG